jgi:hypothetical protein
VVAVVVIRLSSQEEAPGVQEHIETDAARDEYAIRHLWIFVIPPTPADQSAARKERCNR